MGLPHEDLADLQEKHASFSLVVSSQQAKGVSQSQQLKSDLAALRVEFDEEVKTRSGSYQGLLRNVLESIERLNALERRCDAIERFDVAINARVTALEKKPAPGPYPWSK